jgi:spermidine/putrescine transport system permease protein
MTTSLKTAMKSILGTLPAAGIVTVFLVVPLIFVAVYSLMEPHPYGGVQWNLSGEAYRRFLYDRTLTGELVFNEAYLRIFARSFILAFAAMVVCVLIGFPVAYFMAMQSPQRQTLLVFLVTIPFWTNLLIRTYSWILILRDTGLVNSTLVWSGVVGAPVRLLYTDVAILLGLVYMYIPFMILPIYASLARLDLRLVEAAHDLYANRFQAMREVVLPLASTGILAGCVLVFIPSIGNFIAPALLGGGQNLMIGTLIQLQFTSGRNWPFGAAAALILLAIVMLILIAVARGRARKALEAGVG